ncbi:MAG: hypothetical protein CEE38_09420 [Planctomycetes bacterium B3_Pla]|nr:MAG: hypothetical protein CEE38_09420 [Planctomycetes bacterium B3_Pla]
MSDERFLAAQQEVWLGAEYILARPGDCRLDQQKHIPISLLRIIGFLLEQRTQSAAALLREEKPIICQRQDRYEKTYEI